MLLPQSGSATESELEMGGRKGPIVPSLSPLASRLAIRGMTLKMASLEEFDLVGIFRRRA